MAAEEPQCDHAPVIEEMTRARGLLIKIKALLLLPSPPAKLCSELAGELLESQDRALSLLGRRSGLHRVDARAGSPKPNDGGRIKSSVDEKKKKQDEGDDGGGRKRRRQTHPSIIETSDPYHYDDHQWRKYGEKPINGTVHPRYYYRCTYYKDRQCPAKKTVQRKDGGIHDTPEFFLSYAMEHSCRRIEPAFPSAVRVLSFGSNNWTSGGGGGGGGGDELGESSSVGQIRDPGGSPSAETHPPTDAPIHQGSSSFALSRNHECSSTAGAPPVTDSTIPDDGDVDSNMFPLMDHLELSSVAEMIEEWDGFEHVPADGSFGTCSPKFCMPFRAGCNGRL